ncbi:hypothetical protein [Streptomyces sp. NPDC127038]|uniref:hypothetical protein n=1 Tax=Streptomyces sp. NPDC127038 TaxID=3347114 RepID=UPI003646EDDE
MACRLAVVPLGLAVRPVHLDHRDLVRDKEARVPSTPTAEDLAAGPEGYQRPLVALRGSLELLGGQVSADAVDDRGLVEVGVGVYSADHRYLVCHAVVCCPSNAHQKEGAEPVGQTDKTVMGPLARLLTC